MFKPKIVEVQDTVVLLMAQIQVDLKTAMENDDIAGMKAVVRLINDNQDVLQQYIEPTPRPTRQFVREVHAWIATQADGSENIMQAGVGGIGLTPLLSSSRRIAEKMEPYAREAKRAAKGGMISFRLVSFATTEAPPRGVA